MPEESRHLWLSEFHAQKLKPGEDVEVYAYELEQLLMHAIPTCSKSEESKDAMLRHQFIQGMPSGLKEKLLSSVL